MAQWQQLNLFHLHDYTYSRAVPSRHIPRSSALVLIHQTLREIQQPTSDPAPAEFKMTKNNIDGFVFRCQQKQGRKRGYTNLFITTSLSPCDIAKSWSGSNAKCLDKEQSTVKWGPNSLQKSLNLIKCIKDNLSNLRCSHWISEHTYALLSHW